MQNQPPNNPQRERLRLAAPTQPLVWKEVFEAVPEPEGGWPFTDARDEYLKSDYLLDSDTLIRRWAGIDPPERIYAFLALPTIRDLREKVREAIEAGRIVPPITDEDRARVNARRRRETEDAILRNRQRVAQGDYVGVVYENGVPISAYKPLSPAEIARQDKAYIELATFQRLLQGEATEIFESRQSLSVLNIEAQIQAAQTKYDPEYARAQELLSRSREMPALPPFEEGVVVPNDNDTD